MKATLSDFRPSFSFNLTPHTNIHIYWGLASPLWGNAAHWHERWNNPDYKRREWLLHPDDWDRWGRGQGVAEKPDGEAQRDRQSLRKLTDTTAAEFFHVDPVIDQNTLLYSVAA